MTARPLFDMARIAVGIAGVVKINLLPIIDNMTTAAFARPVTGRCRMASRTEFIRFVFKTYLEPIVRLVALAALARPMPDRRLVTGGADPQIGVIHVDHPPIDGVVTLGALFAIVIGRRLFSVATDTIGKACMVKDNVIPSARIVTIGTLIIKVAWHARMASGALWKTGVFVGRLLPVTAIVTH